MKAAAALALLLSMQQVSYLTAAVDACFLPEGNELLHQALLLPISQVIVEHAWSARMSHQVD